jgi:hypothetical protein
MFRIKVTLITELENINIIYYQFTTITNILKNPEILDKYYKEI